MTLGGANRHVYRQFVGHRLHCMVGAPPPPSSRVSWWLPVDGISVCATADGDGISSALTGAWHTQPNVRNDRVPAREAGRVPNSAAVGRSGRLRG